MSVLPDNNKTNEAEWVDLARKGSEKGWEELHRMYYPGLWGTVNQMVRDEALAEDIVQEAFIKAYKKIRRFRREAKFGTWIYRIAVNQAYDTIRKQGRRSRWIGLFPTRQEYQEDGEAPELEPVDNRTAGDQAALTDDRQAIEAAMASLSPDHRAVVDLRLIQGFSTEETAKILGCRRGTVLSRLFYSCQKLKKILEPTYRDQKHL